MTEKHRNEPSEAQIKLILAQTAEAGDSLPDDDWGVRSGRRWGLGCGGVALVVAGILIILVPAKWLLILCGIPLCAGLGFIFGVLVNARKMMDR